MTQQYPPSQPPPTWPEPGIGPQLGGAPAPPARGKANFSRGFGAGFGWAVGAGLVVLVVGTISTGILTLGLLALGASSTTSTSSAVTVWGDEMASNVVLAIPVNGVILGDSAGQPPLFGQGVYGYDVAAQLDSLEVGDADAVVLELNTPGGTIYGSKAISDAVQRYQERTKNPVVAYVRGMSASGGMYAMAGADRIIVDHGTMVGSIGVIMGPFERYRDVTAVDGGLLGGGVTANGGIDSYYLSRGKGKDFGNPFRDMSPEERANMDVWLDSEYQAFVEHVATRRDIPAQTIVDQYGAFMFGPKQAVQNKLADVELGQEEAYREVARLADVDPDDTQVIMEQAEIDFLSLLLGATSGAEPGSSEAGSAGQARSGQTQPELAQGRAAVHASGLCTGAASVLAINGNLADYCSG